MIATPPTARFRRPALRALGATALALLVAAPASARQSDQSTEAPSSRIPGWSFTPSLAAGTIYDNNVALTTAPAETGQTQGDAYFSLVPGGQLEFVGKHTEFSASYRGFVRRYLDVEGLNGFDQQGALSLRRTLSRRVTIMIRDTFLDSPTTDDVQVNGVPFRRTGSRTNRLAAGAEVRLSKYTTWSARYDQNWVSFDRPDVFLTGGWIHGLNNEVSHRISERVALGGEYEFRMASLDRASQEFAFQDVGGVMRLTLGPHTSASASGGFATMHDRTLDETRTGPYVRLGVSHEMAKASIGATFERQFVPSFGFGGSSDSQELSGFVVMPLRRGLYTQGSAAWRRTDPFEGDVLELDSLWLRSAVGYAASRWARVELLYTYTRQDSIVTGGEVDRHRIGVQFVISQPMRIQ